MSLGAHGTSIPAPGADRRGRSYRNSRAYAGKTHKPRSQKAADAMHASTPRKYVGRRFRSVLVEDDVAHGGYGSLLHVDRSISSGPPRARRGCTPSGLRPSTG